MRVYKKIIGGCGLPGCDGNWVAIYDWDGPHFEGNPQDFPVWEYCDECGQGDGTVLPEGWELMR